jgi:short-subunit dehydrogenase
MGKLPDQPVVVITGASSGIGRETALMFALRGARLVLAARSDDALKTLSDEVHRLGGRAEIAICDVAEFDQVHRVAELAAHRFGRIDVWINNAAVSTYGTAEQMEIEEIHRVLHVNLFGQIHGMKAALPHLRLSHGTLINVTSVLGKRAAPLQAAYSAAKHGIIGFSEALRVELRHGNVPVDVVDVRPSGINTPLFEHARSKIGVRPQPIPPVYEPRTVAEAVLAAADKPVREVVVGAAGRMLEIGQRLSPALVDWYSLGPGKMIESQYTDAAGDGQDNLFAPMPGTGRVAGQFGSRSKSTSLYTMVFGGHPARGRIAAAVAILGAGWLLRRAGNRR